MSRIHLLATAMGLGSALVCNTAFATDVFILEGRGAKSRAMGGTGVAFDVGPAGLMLNPATMSLGARGSLFSGGLDIITADIAADGRASNEYIESKDGGANNGPYFIPEVGYVWRGERWSFGIGAFGQGGLGVNYGSDSFLSDGASGTPTGLENSARLLVLDIPISASFDVTDKLSIGASLDPVWAALNLNLLLGANQVGALIGQNRVQGTLLPVLGTLPALDAVHIGAVADGPVSGGIDAWGLGGRVGLVYRATPATTLGASYTFKTALDDLSGSATVTAVDLLAGQVPLQGELLLRDFQMPATATIGVAHRINDRLTVSADLSRVFWSDAMKDLNVGFTTAAGADLSVALPQTYDDQTILGVGVEYVSGPWSLRAGGRVANQALQDEQLFAVVPAIPTRHASFGVGYAIDGRSSLDLSYTHAFEETMSNSGPPNAIEPLSVSHSQNNVAVSYTIRFGAI